MKPLKIKQKKKNIMSGIYLLPNLITTAALFCGINAVIQSIKGTDMPKAAYFILLATVFEGTDGGAVAGEYGSLIVYVAAQPATRTQNKTSAGSFGSIMARFPLDGAFAIWQS